MLQPYIESATALSDSIPPKIDLLFLILENGKLSHDRNSYQISQNEDFLERGRSVKLFTTI